jgi:hypothetical protein
MKRKRPVQYTIRDVPARLDQRLREAAAEYKTSLNKATVSALARGLGLEEEAPVHHDLDDLIGSWVQDDAFDRAMADMDRVDEDLWR